MNGTRYTHVSQNFHSTREDAMADYESDIEDDILAESDAGELEDAEYAEEINAAINADIEYDVLEVQENNDDENSEKEDIHEDDEDEELLADQKDDVCDAEDVGLPGELTNNAGDCTRRDMIQFREIIKARESRMPDIPTIFELGGLIISRATTLVANSTPMIPFEVFDPAKIARSELVHGKSLRAVMRGDAYWRWSDFTCFPRGFMDENETVDRLHEMR